MKYVELHRTLSNLGWVITRSTKHIIYSKGVKTLAVPNKKEIQIFLAKRLIKEAQDAV